MISSSAASAPTSTVAFDTTARKTISHRLSTGNTIELTAQEERMLKSAYDFIAGYAQRIQKEAAFEKKKEHVATLFANLPSSARVSVLPRPADLPSLLSKAPPGDNSGLTETERKLDEFLRAKAELMLMDEELKDFSSVNRIISFKDIEAALDRLGANVHRKDIEQMIWEVDENSDSVIDYEEFQLTYYRNITDITGNEPCAFFHILEFLTFDEQHKGYIIEDDCMEILFARHGSSKLENEMQLLFGSNLRSAGGNGTLDISAYLSSCLRRTGRRALVAASTTITSSKSSSKQQRGGTTAGLSTANSAADTGLSPTLRSTTAF